MQRYGTLLAMRVIEELRSQMRFAYGKYLSKINSLLLGNVADDLQRFETVRGEGGNEFLIVEQMLVVETEHGEYARLNHGDCSTTV